MKKILMAAAAVVTFGAVSGTASAELCGGDDEPGSSLSLKAVAPASGRVSGRHKSLSSSVRT